jgi:hypothetical protein
VKCIRCDSPGTHTEWNYRGEWKTIEKFGKACALCDLCYLQYEELRKIEACMDTLGIKQADRNTILMAIIDLSVEARMVS